MSIYIEQRPEVRRIIIKFQEIITQLTFTYSKSTIQTLEKGVNMFKVNFEHKS